MSLPDNALPGAGRLFVDHEAEKARISRRLVETNQMMRRHARQSGQMSLPIEDGLIVDLFCGGGGFSVGLEQALGRPVNVAVNHDIAAIGQHAINFPLTEHLISDVFDVDPMVATGGRPVSVLAASPDCTHFSRAKGGSPRDQKIRSLPWVVVKWMKAVAPSLCVVENVPELQTWGPLTKSGRPIKSRLGETFREWLHEMTECGYDVEWRVLNAADYGTPQRRNRLFVIARRRDEGIPIRWPAPTHGPGTGRPYVSAASCIDWSIETRSIFGRDRPLAEKTLKRIALGVVKYVLTADTPYIAPSSNEGDSIRSSHITKFRQNSHGIDARDPFPTLTSGAGSKRAAGAAHALGVVDAVFVAQHNQGAVGFSIDRPMSTLTSRVSQQQLVAAHLVKLRRHSDGASLQEPMGTITAGGFHHGVIESELSAAHLMTMRSGCTGGDLSEPLGTVTAGLHHGVVETALSKEATEGMQRVLDFLSIYFEPPATGPASKFKVCPESLMVNVKGEMFCLTDIRLRMISPREAYSASGFSEDYIIDPVIDYRTDTGNIKRGRLPKSQQVAKCGNAVPPPMARALFEANFAPLVSESMAA